MTIIYKRVIKVEHGGFHAQAATVVRQVWLSQSAENGKYSISNRSHRFTPSAPSTPKSKVTRLLRGTLQTH